eukprot:12041236-Alexandrium_andersonii.AAC.1
MTLFDSGCELRTRTCPSCGRTPQYQPPQCRGASRASRTWIPVENTDKNLPTTQWGTFSSLARS